MDSVKQNDNSVSFPFLLDVKMGAKRCGIGVTLFRQLDADGSLPEACKLHTRKLWSNRQLEIWSILGCPARNSEIWREMLESFKKTSQAL